MAPLPWTSRVPLSLPCTHAIITTPADSSGALAALDVHIPRYQGLLPGRCQPSPYSNGVGVRIALFEACSMFTHIMACALPDPLEEAFSQSARTALLPPPSLQAVPGGA